MPLPTTYNTISMATESYLHKHTVKTEIMPFKIEWHIKKTHLILRHGIQKLIMSGRCSSTQLCIDESKSPGLALTGPWHLLTRRTTGSHRGRGTWRMHSINRSSSQEKKKRLCAQHGCSRRTDGVMIMSFTLGIQSSA